MNLKKAIASFVLSGSICAMGVVVAAPPVSASVSAFCTSVGATQVGSTQECLRAFTSTGSTTWTLPSGITTIRYLVVGGGGGGQNGTPSAGAVSKGGAGGQVLSSASVAVASAATLSITVGAGGSAPSGTSGLGGNGGSSSLSGGGITVSANGGLGNQNSGTGSTGTSNDITGTSFVFGSGGGGSNQSSGVDHGVANRGGGGYAGAPFEFYGSVSATAGTGGTSGVVYIRFAAVIAPSVTGTPSVATASDLGDSNSDSITSDTTPMMEATGLDVGATVSMTATNGSETVTCTFVAASTTGGCSLPQLSDGTWSVTSSQSLNGVSSALSQAHSVSIDSTPPGVPTYSLTSGGSPLSNGGATSSNSISLASGPTSSGSSSISCSLNGGARQTPCPSTFSPLLSGTNNIAFTAVDAAGNETTDTFSFNYPGQSSTSTTSPPPAVVAATTTTTIATATAATSTTAARNSNVVTAGKRISICRRTSSATNPYVLITVYRNSLNGHSDHDGDIIPAPASGCPTSLATEVATTTTVVAVGRISICHANANGTYSQITVAQNSLNGRSRPSNDIIPAPSDGCPFSVRQYALQLVRTSGTTTVPGALPAVSVTTVPNVIDSSKITICHATAAGFYVEITVDRSGLNGHGDHDGDIIPAPASGCPFAVSRQVVPTTTVPAGKIAICHATAAGIYVSIVVDRDGLNGHGDHAGDLIPAPADGCPTRMSAQSAPSTIPKPPAGKIGICHVSVGGSLQYVLVDKETLDGHGDHGQDIIPAPVTGCSNPSSTVSPPTTVACINARELENFDELANSLTAGVKVSAAQSPTDEESGTIKISNTTNGPALSLVSAESVDPGIKVTVKSSGVDYNKAITWANEGYGSYCWKLEPFGDRDYIYTLPNPPEPPDSRYAGLPYSAVIVKAGSITTTDPNYQVNTVFYSPEPGSGVFADVNKNGVSDPGGQGGGDIGDKSISHIVVCVGNVSSLSVTPASTLPVTTAPSPFLTTTTTINWSADFCPEPTTTTSANDGSVSTTTTSSTSTTSTTTTTTTTTTTVPEASTTTAPDASTTSTTVAPGISTTTTTAAPGISTTTTVPESGIVTTTSVPGTVIATTTTQPGGTDAPNPPIELIVESQSIPKDGVTDLALTLSDGVKLEVVFLQLDVHNFSVVADSLPATGQERWNIQQQLGWLMIVGGLLLGAIEFRRRATLRR